MGGLIGHEVGDKDKDKGEKKEKAESSGEKKSETKGSVTVGGKKIDYDATAGTIQLKNQKDEPRASVFYISYTRNGVDDLTKRPITLMAVPGSLIAGDNALDAISDKTIKPNLGSWSNERSLPSVNALRSAFA